MTTISKQQLVFSAILLAILAAVVLFVLFTAVESFSLVGAGGSSTMGQCLISISGCTGA